MYHLITFLYPIVLILSLYFILRKQSYKVKKWVLFGVCLANIVLYVSYKFTLHDIKEVIILNELPLHLCNLNLILIPLALLLNKKFLYSYIYYVGVAGAIIGIAVYDSAYNNQPFGLMAIQGFFIYHALLLTTSLLPVLLGLYRPKFKDIFLALIVLLCLYSFMSVVNVIFRKTGILEISNYFYTFGMPGNPLAEFLWKIIPLPFLYLIPGVVIWFPLDCLMYSPFFIIDKVRLKKAKQIDEPEKVEIDNSVEK